MEIRVNWAGWTRVLIGWLVAVLTAGCQVGCGGHRSDQGSEVRAAPPPVGVDLTDSLPADPSLAGAFWPHQLAELGHDLIKRSPNTRFGVNPGVAARLLDTGWVDALGMSPSEPVWFSLSAGHPLQVLRYGEDAQKILEAPRYQRFESWLIDHPLPPVWLHARLVGAAVSTDPPQPEDYLARHYGATQVARPDDGAESIASALGTTVAAVEPWLGRLAQTPPATIIRLLEAELPTILLIRQHPDRVIVDWIQDQDLGRDALAAGLADVLVDNGASERVEATGPVENKPVDKPASPAVGRPNPHEIVRLHLPHRPWVRLVRTLGEAAVLHLVLTSETLPVDPLTLVKEGRRAAQMPERLMGVGGGSFVSSRVDLVRPRAEALELRIHSAYAPGRGGLSHFAGGQAPLSHKAIAHKGTFALTLAGDPPRWDPVATRLLRAPAAPLDHFLADVVRCGLVCWPAVWCAVPVYGQSLGGAASAVFPEVGLLSEGLALAHGLSVVVTTEPTRGFAAALRYPAPAHEARKVWERVELTLESTWRTLGNQTLLFVGNNPQTLSTLIEAAEGTQGPPLPTESSALVATTRLSPALSTAFSHLTVDVAFEAKALQITSTLTLRALDPASP